MHDGPLWRIAILSLILILPAAADARPPEANREVATSLGAQKLTDVDMDPTGQFTVAVVEVDGQKTVNSLIPGGQQHRDIYPCDFGSVTNPRSGSGCRGVNHAAGTSTALGNRQVVDVTSITSGGLFGLYAVGGPSNTLSLWSTRSDTALWERTVGSDSVVLDVAIAPDGRRIAAALAQSELASSGRVAIYDDDDHGRFLWDYNLTDSQGGAVRPTSLAISRENGVLAVGTTNGVVLFDLDGARPNSASTPGIIGDTGHVYSVALSSKGDAIALAAERGVFFAPLKKTGSKVELESIFMRFSSEFPSAATDVTLSLDGQRFAVAAGSKLHFFKRLNDANLATPVGDAFDAGAAITDIAADGSGRFVAAIAGDNVYGFGATGNNTPIWSFTATKAGFGGLDGPLKRVQVSEGGDRIVVGGATKVMPYSNVISARAAITAQEGNETILPAITRQLTLSVTNTGSLPDNYTVVVDRPVGWNGENPAYVALDPEQTANVNLTITPPPGQSPGPFAVSVKIRSQELLDRGRTDAIVAGASFNLTVPRAVSLLVDAPDAPLQMRQGEERTVSVTIRNVGNAGGLVNLTAEQELTRGASWDVRFSREQVDIPADSQASVDVRITAPAGAGSGDRNIIKILAREGTNVAANDTVTAYVNAEFRADLRADNSTLEFAPAEIRVVPITIINRGNTLDKFNLTYVLSPQTAINDWRVTLDREQIEIPRGDSRIISVTIKPNVAVPDPGTLTIKTISQSDPAKTENSVVLSLFAKPQEPSEDDRLLPAPGALALLAVLGLVPMARRLMGGRRE